MDTTKKTTIQMDAWTGSVLMAAGMTDDERERFTAAVEYAIGTGGWNRDPADPLKRPWSPENAAIAAATRHDESERWIPILTALCQQSRAENWHENGTPADRMAAMEAKNAEYEKRMNQ